MTSTRSSCGAVRREHGSTETVDRDVFDFTLAASLRGARAPHFIAVHGVEGLDPGLAPFAGPRPTASPLGSLARSPDGLLGPEPGRDAAFVVMGIIDRVDDRAYREAQLEAGIVEGRLHLAAYALGIGASGMTFLDDEIEPLLGAPLQVCCSRASACPRTRAGPAGCRSFVAIITPAPGETLREPDRACAGFLTGVVIAMRTIDVRQGEPSGRSSVQASRGTNVTVGRLAAGFGPVDPLAGHARPDR